MKLVHATLVTIITFFVYIKDGNAQDVYRTLDGQMLITAISNDTVLKVTSKSIGIKLVYETAKFTIKIDKSSFVTGVDSLDERLSKLKYDIIEYKGKFNIDRIEREGHPPMDFDVEGSISTNDKIIKGRGHLEHIANRGTFSCLLTLKFNIDKQDLGLNLDDLPIDDKLQIDIVQSVLNRYTDQ